MCWKLKSFFFYWIKSKGYTSPVIGLHPQFSVLVQKYKISVKKYKKVLNHKVSEIKLKNCLKIIENQLYFIVIITLHGSVS